VQGIANAAYLEGFPFPALLSVAPYCVPGGIRVVSRMLFVLLVCGDLEGHPINFLASRSDRAS
jgi:hypothetical protein